MNKEHIKLAIQVMQDVRKHRRMKFDLRQFQFQSAPSGRYVETKEEAIECGTACCFSGWLAIHPLIRAIPNTGRGGEGYFQFTPDGSEHEYGLNPPAEDLARFLGIDYNLACNFIYNNVDPETGKPFYGVPMDKVTPAMVIKKLQILLETP